MGSLSAIRTRLKQYGSIGSGDLIMSPGASFMYKVIGPVCRLYDREELPWPCCSLQWKGKQPSWKRVGSRLVPDMGGKRSPSYNVYLMNGDKVYSELVYTCYWIKLTSEEQEWWYTPNSKLKYYYSENLNGSDFKKYEELENAA